MVSVTLEKILSCPALPTLPAAALKLLELVRDPNVALDRITPVVQGDPALAAKVLRTVNSSYYGLGQKCTKIDRALSFLGLNAVKSLVLGFSLVDSMKRVGGDGGFDIAQHWRRTIYGAAAARQVCAQTRSADPEEAFTAAVVQDIGMLAAHAVMGADYDEVLRSAPRGHWGFPLAELNAMGISHPQIGCELAKKWKLPDGLIDVIRYHHKPDEAPEKSQPVARAVTFGLLVAEAMNPDATADDLELLRDRAAKWYPEVAADLKRTLEKITVAANELATLLDCRIGQCPDIGAIMAMASEQMLEAQIAQHQETAQLRMNNADLAREAVTDALTRAHNRKCFDADLSERFAQASAGGRPLGVLFVDADRFKSVNDLYGHQAGDAVLKELSRRLREALEGVGTVYRYGGEEFAALMPDTGTRACAATAERVRAAVEAPEFDLSGIAGAPQTLRVTVSIGVAAHQSESPFADGAALVHAADEAVYRAKQNGRNRVEVAGALPAAPSQAIAAGASVELPTPVSVNASAAPPAETRAACTQGCPETIAAPTGPGATVAAIGPQAAKPAATPGVTAWRVLLIEDDALAAKLVEASLRRAGLRVTWVCDPEEALRMLREPAERRAFDAVWCDYNLEPYTAVDMLYALRGRDEAPSVPFFVITSHDAERIGPRCMQAGATLVASKIEVCASLPEWPRRIGEQAAAAHGRSAPSRAA